LYADSSKTKDKIIVTDAGNSPMFLIDLKKALSGVLGFERNEMSPEE
jgi:hypothetical protein